MKPAILIIEDEEAVLFAYSAFFGKSGYEVASASTLSEARDIVTSRRFDAVLLDLNLPDGNSLSWIKDLRADNPDLAIVVSTGMGDVPTAVEAMRLGADNFLTKPLNLKGLDVFLKKGVEIASLRRSETIRSRSEKKEDTLFGESPVMAPVINLLQLMAKNDAPVLLQGETGTGKGVFAKWIHENSPRNTGPFIEVNCASFQKELLLSELFGHAKGAFTSAVQSRQGLIEIADGGTLFLDEIGDMDPGVQAQLLKVLEEKTYRRMGETNLRRSDFRLITASNRDLEELSRKGPFRRDLLFRINQVAIEVPPLRERTGDLHAFAEYFLKIAGAADRQISGDVMDMLKRYGWPGNLRELRNVIERAVILSGGDRLKKDHFPGLRPAGLSDDGIEKRPAGLKDIELDYIEKLIDEHEGDKLKTAEALGISKATLYRKLKELRARD